MADYVFETLDKYWDRTVVEIELYMAALRRPALASAYLLSARLHLYAGRIGSGLARYARAVALDPGLLVRWRGYRAVIVGLLGRALVGGLFAKAQMSRVLVFGADGMLGHVLARQLRAKHEVAESVRADADVRDEAAVARVLRAFRPEVVLNAAGTVKQRMDAEEAATAIEVNAVFPHRLARLCEPLGARVIHFSTDCVFSGERGAYTETDPTDARDLYGRSKLLGEPAYPHCLTLRTSMIGRELRRKSGLLEWFLAQKGSVRGYRQAIFSGFTTIELARVIERIIGSGRPASGLYHVSAAPISKYELLRLVKSAFGLKTEIRPDDELRIDRSLDSTRFRGETGYRPPDWPAMVAELAHEIREAHA